MDFNDFDRARALMMASELSNTLTDIDAAARALSAEGGKVGVIGFAGAAGWHCAAPNVLISRQVFHFMARVSTNILISRCTRHFWHISDCQMVTSRLR